MSDDLPAPTEPGPAHDPASWESFDTGPHVWRTQGWQRGPFAAGSASVLWEPGDEASFPSGDGRLVHGGLQAAVLDAALASACFTVTGPEQRWVTATLSVDLVRAARPGPLTATGTVVRRTRAVVFCAGTLVDAGGRLLATARATQVPARG